MTCTSKIRILGAVAGLLVVGFGGVACGSGTDKPESTTGTTSTTAPAGSGSPTATRPAGTQPAGTQPAATPPATSAPSSPVTVTSTVPMMPNPNGDGTMVPCEGSICTNPNHGAGTNPEDNGGVEMPNPNGDGSAVPCEGSICTNPNHGAGDGDGPPEPGQTEFTGPGGN